MQSMIQTGIMRGRRRKALIVMLACSALTSVAAAQTPSIFPPQGTSGTLPGRSAATVSAGELRGSTGPAETSAETAANQTLQPSQAGSLETTQVDPPYEDDLNQPYEQPLDPGAEPLDTQEPPRRTEDPTGVRLGTFLLRPSITQGIETERTKSSGASRERDYLSTTIRGTLTSDWSRHALTITGESNYERNIRGGQDGLRPETNINADLRLDLSNDTVAHITAGYSFTREDDYDPNAIGGASTQSGVHQLTSGLSVERDLGKIRGLAALDLNRSTYTDAELTNGSSLSRKDRNRTGVDGRLRLGYELSPAFVPFMEVATGRDIYDLKRDGAGFARSSRSYAARAGIEFDRGEKLRGEIGMGYELVDYDDSRLKSIDGVTFNGNVVWSPQRGTDLDLRLRSTIQDSTTPGESGWVEYQLTAALAHEMRHDLVARLTAGTTLRDFPSGQDDETVWVAGAGLTWSINRYLDLTGDVEHERASGGADDKIWRAGVGLTLRR